MPAVDANCKAMPRGRQPIKKKKPALHRVTSSKTCLTGDLPHFTDTAIKYEP